MFHPDFPTENLVPAPYNPRAISPDALLNLQKSIATIGFTKPIIVDPRHVIAGHQRTKAARNLGRLTVPAFVIKRDVVMSDEIMFNQLHNGTDLDVVEYMVSVPPGPEGFEDVPWTSIDGPDKAGGVTVRRMIADLIERYGLWGCAVATMSGLVISSQQYALTCRTLRQPCRVYRIPDDKAEIAGGFFSMVYGKFSYAHLQKDTFMQSFAQPVRLREKKDHVTAAGRTSMTATGGASFESVCYRDYLPKHYYPGARILDFGCGQGDYVRRQTQLGYNIRGMEFFRRPGFKPMIDTKAVHKMVAELLPDFEKNGPYDIVICEAVINSVDTLEAQASVLGCINLFCKMGGTVIWGGRVKGEGADAAGAARMKSDRSGSPTARREIEFLDDDGFSGIYMVPYGSAGGRWIYQLYHTRSQAEALMDEYGFGRDKRITWAGTYANWQASGTKTKEIPAAQAEAALTFEFNLPWPGSRVNRHVEAVAAYRKAYANIDLTFVLPEPPPPEPVEKKVRKKRAVKAGPTETDQPEGETEPHADEPIDGPRETDGPPPETHEPGPSETA